MWHVGKTEEGHIGFRWETLIERDSKEDLGGRWKDNVKNDLQEVGWGGMDRIDMVQDKYMRPALLRR
jgi:hypothetical protein